MDANSEVLSDIYDVYRKYIQAQMNTLEQMDYSKSWALSEGRYLMQPLLNSRYSNDHKEPVDENILIQRMAKIKSLSLENEGIRQIVSAEQVYEMDEINIFESKMTQAAEYLLKEIKSEATLKNLIGVVCAEDNFLEGINNILCNYDMYNILHQYALSNKEVSKIVVNYSQRRIQLTYSLNKESWYKFELKSRGMEKVLFVPKSKFLIDGLQDEIGIKTYGAIYIRSDSPIYEYVTKTIKIFLEEDSKENKILLEVFLGNIFDSNILEQTFSTEVDTNNMVRQMIEERFFRLSDEMLKKMWSKINVEEFTRVILTQNYTLYSIANWSRKEDNI